MRISREYAILLAYGFLACSGAFFLPILMGATAEYAYDRPVSFIGGVVK